MKRAPITAVCTLLMLLIACGGGGGGGNNSGGGGSSGGTQGTGGPLSITTTSLPDGFSGKPYSAAIAVSGGNGRLKWSVAPGSSLLGGLTLNADTGQLGGAYPGNGSVFANTTFRVTDSGSPQQIAEKTLRMQFNPPLSVSAGNPPFVGHTNVPYSQDLWPIGAVGNVNWTVSKGQLPPGVSLGNATAKQASLAGAPTQTGAFAFTVQVTDSYSPPQVATLDVTITVDNKLSIVTQQLPPAWQGEPYSTTVVAVNGTPPYHWSGQFFSGYAIDSNTGTITNSYPVGNLWMNVTVTDSASPANTSTQSFTVTALQRLQLQSATLWDGHLGELYNATLWASGGVGMKAFSVVSGSLPPGLTLTSQYGYITGVPSQLGTYTFTVQVVDSYTPPETAQGQFTITTKPGTLTLQPSLPQRAPINVPFSAVAAVTGGIAPYTWAISNGGLPTGLSLNTSTGEISGTPTTLGYFFFGLKVTDSSATPQTTTNGYGITVGAALGRNDAIANATSVGNGQFSASISPISDPVASATIAPDTDYYRIRGGAGSVVKVEIFGSRYNTLNPLDSVLELVDANGARLNTCRLPGDSTTNFNSPCLDDDISKGVNLDSQLEIQMPGAAGTQGLFYAHVLDWRGDARPDMTYTLQVSGAVDPLSITTKSLNGVQVGTAYSAQFASTGGTGAITWAITAGALPPGITLSPAGAITGTCDTPGTYNFSVTATDSGSPAQQASAAYSLIIGTPPVITTTGFPDAYTGVPYSPVPLVFTGGTPPFSYSFMAANGLTLGLDPTGMLAGTPQYPGTFGMAIGVRDALGLWDSRNYTIAIHPGPLSVPPTSATATVGVISWFWIYPAGGTPNYSCSLSSGSLPPGMSLVVVGGVPQCQVSGTPTAAGTFTATFTVTDSAQPPQTATGTVTVIVSP